MIKTVLGAALLGSALFGCVAKEQQDAVDARKQYEQCVETKSATHDDCLALRESYLAAQRRYEDAARRRWTCDPAQEECPRRR